MTDETIRVGQTLDLTYYITNNEKLKYSNKIDFNDAESNGEIKYAESTYWKPDKKGIHTIEVDGKELIIEVIDIPENIIDNFENEKNSPYSNKESISNYYSGNTNKYTRTKSKSISGNFALSRSNDGSSGESIVSLPGDGLNYYPQEGEEVHALMYVPTSDNVAGYFGFGLNKNGNGYGVICRSGDVGLTLIENSGTNRSNLDEDNTISAPSEWVEIHARPPTKDDNSIWANIYKIEQEFPFKRKSQIAYLSDTDDTYTDQRGIGAIVGSSTGTGVLLDWIVTGAKSGRKIKDNN